MRKCYVVMAYWKLSGNRYLAAVTTSLKKAERYVERFSSDDVCYEIKTEVLL